MEIIKLVARLSPFFLNPLELQLWSCNSAIPPQSLLFPLIETAFAFVNTSHFGTAPSKSLSDRFNLCKKTKPFKKFGSFPKKLLLERSLIYTFYFYISIEFPHILAFLPIYSIQFNRYFV